MSLNIPGSATEIFNRMAVDLTIELDTLDPFLRASFVRSILASDSNAFFELYKTLLQLSLQSFWDTATGEYLERWAAIYGITRNPATKASGFVTFTGIDTTVIPISTQFTSESGDVYQTLNADQIETTALSITSLTRVSQTAAAITSVDHGLASNMEVTIAGANQTEYNGTFVIVVTSLNSFTYTVTGSPTTPATGTITATATYANIESESIGFGAANNLESGTKVSLSTPIAGADSDGYVSFDEIAGGVDEEDDESLRDRFLFRVQNPIALFNNNAIEAKAKEVPGVTRVWVQNVDFLADAITASGVTRSGDFAKFTTAAAHGLFNGQVINVDGADQPAYNITNQKILVIDTTNFGYVVVGTPTTPATGTIVASFGVASLGQVRVFFVRDNDTNIIPSPSEVDAVRDAVISIKPAPVSSSDVIVEAPIPITVNFTFSAISPNTQDMKDAIIASLENYFSTGTNVAQDVTKLEYDSVIISTVDNAGNRLESFTLSTPTTDISIGVSELALLGTITFP